MEKTCTNQSKSDMPQISPEILNLYLYGRKDNTLKTRHKCVSVPSSVFVPPQLRLDPSTLPGSEVGVFSSTWIRPGTMFGPVEGHVAPPSAISPEKEAFAWEVWSNQGHLSHYVVVDMTSWTAYVSCARHEMEQNLILLQKGQKLYFEAIRLIRPGEELCVWYGPSYSLYMGILEPVQDSTQQNNTTPSDTPQADEGTQTCKCRCMICRRPFNSRSNLRSHMRIHTMEKPFTCSYCQRAFSQSSTLRNHMRLHTGEKPYRCVTCSSSYSQLAGLRAHQKSARHRIPDLTMSPKHRH